MKYTVRYNSENVGKDYRTLKEARQEWKRLFNLNLFGYKISKL